MVTSDSVDTCADPRGTFELHSCGGEGTPFFYLILLVGYTVAVFLVRWNRETLEMGAACVIFGAGDDRTPLLLIEAVENSSFEWTQFHVVLRVLARCAQTTANSQGSNQAQVLACPQITF